MVCYGGFKGLKTFEHTIGISQVNGLQMNLSCVWIIGVRGVHHGKGSHVFITCLTSTFVFVIYDPKGKGKIWCLKNSISQSEMMQFQGFSRTGEAVQNNL